MIAEDDINFSNTIDPATLDWYYTSVRLTNADELFALCAIEKDKKHVILRHPIKVTINKIEGNDDGYNLKWGEYNPFSDDEYTRFRVEQIHSINFLNDKFRTNYKQILKEKYGDEDVDTSGEAEELPGDTKPVEESMSLSPEIKESVDFLPVTSGNVKDSINKKLH